MAREEPLQERETLGRFTCNVCGAENESGAGATDRERASCTACRSCIRFRSIVLALSRELFGMDLKLCDFPRLKSIRGLGISDPEVYSRRLEKCFSYRNTFYHRAPAFDLSQPDEAEFGKYDFVICSEILEHVQPPVERAFNTLSRLLKPAGVLILTAPYALAGKTREHFPSLHESVLAEISGRTVLVNRSADGQFEVFDDLVFHGGHGSTLELREFSESDLRARMAAAGFSTIRFDSKGNKKFGVVFSDLCSLPIIATREPFSLGTGGIGELAEQLVEARAVLQAVRESRWLRLGRLFGLGPKIRPPF